MEVLQPTRLTEEYEDETNEEFQRIEKNFLEERRDEDERRMDEYQRPVKCYQNACAKPRYFDVGDLVMRNRSASKPLEAGKMAIDCRPPKESRLPGHGTPISSRSVSSDRHSLFLFSVVFRFT